MEPGSASSTTTFASPLSQDVKTTPADKQAEVRFKSRSLARSLSYDPKEKSADEPVEAKFKSRSLLRSTSVATSCPDQERKAGGLRRRFSFSRGIVAAAAPAAVDYTKIPEMLRFDLKRLEQDRESIERFVKNIKYSINVLAQKEQMNEQGGAGGKDDEICQQVYLRKLFDQPYCKFTAEDFPMLIKLIQAKRVSPHSAILEPLAAMIAHSFVADIAGLHDLSPVELDQYRTSQDQKRVELGERLARRIVYLCSDDTPMERLERIAHKPELILKVGFSKRKARKIMEKYISDLDSWRIRATDETYAIKGLFLVFIQEYEKHKGDEFYILETFEKANEYLGMLHERTGVRVKYLSLEL